MIQLAESGCQSLLTPPSGPAPTAFDSASAEFHALIAKNLALHSQKTVVVLRLRFGLGYVTADCGVSIPVCPCLGRHLTLIATPNE